MRCGAPRWAKLPDDSLLDLRFSDLGLSLAETNLEPRIQAVIAEAHDRGLRIRPHYWLSNEWFTPDGVTGFAIPFYLAHRRLTKLEERQVCEVDGRTAASFIRIVRHELGHVVDNAFRLHRKRSWQQVFGKASRTYPEYYRPTPNSHNYVLHFNHWYAQSHPSEDFAETFAVWLTPESQWRQRYLGWPALRKLEYVDGLMRDLAGVAPPVRNREIVEPLNELPTTLREYYEEKRARFEIDCPDISDFDLRRLFTARADDARTEPASRFLNRIRPAARRRIARWSGEHEYTIEQVLQAMIERCRALELRVAVDDADAVGEATTLLAIQTMNFVHSGRHRMVL